MGSLDISGGAGGGGGGGDRELHTGNGTIDTRISSSLFFLTFALLDEVEGRLKRVFNVGGLHTCSLRFGMETESRKIFSQSLGTLSLSLSLSQK